MIEVTCWNCGRKGQASERFARRLAACKRCRAVNLIPTRPVRARSPLGRAVAVGRPEPSPMASA